MTTQREPQIDPFCAHHGKRWSEHEGGRCLYCCICFKALTPDECAVDSAGQKWGVCKGQCAKESGITEQGALMTSLSERDLGWYRTLLAAGIAYPFFATAEATLTAGQVDAIGRQIRAGRR